MIAATVAPQVGFISPFGTTACNVNHINAAAQPRLEVDAQRTLEGVGCSRWFGRPVADTLRLRPSHAPRLASPVGLTQHALEHFATGGPRQRVHEVNGTRPFETP